MEIERDKIWVANLPPKITEFAILKIFKAFGQLKDFFFHYENEDNNHKAITYCFITFERIEDAERAQKQLNGYFFHGRTLVVQLAKPKLLENGNIDLRQFEIFKFEIEKQKQICPSKASVEVESEVLDKVISQSRQERDREYLSKFSQPDFYDKLSGTKPIKIDSITSQKNPSSVQKESSHLTIKKIELALQNMAKQKSLPSFSQEECDNRDTGVKYLSKINEAAQKRKRTALGADYCSLKRYRKRF